MARIPRKETEQYERATRGVRPEGPVLVMGAIWADHQKGLDGWCSICRAPIANGVHIFKQADLGGGPFRHDIDHHVVCTSCVDTMAAAIINRITEGS